jgi:hypothetical protein
MATIRQECLIVGRSAVRLIHVGFIAEKNIMVAKFVASAKNQHLVEADTLLAVSRRCQACGLTRLFDVLTQFQQERWEQNKLLLPMS